MLDLPGLLIGTDPFGLQVGSSEKRKPEAGAGVSSFSDHCFTLGASMLAPADVGTLFTGGSGSRKRRMKAHTEVS